MIKEYDKYNIASHFISAIEYGDTTGLSDSEEEELNAFLDSLPRGYPMWQWSDEESFSRDEVTGLMAQCLEGTLFIDFATI